ncbi:23S rRNA (adenine(2503)-C(2))-methyltransferase RlmN [candidate division KSB1 bacterium]|nr:23S rRNA (adenine(2503)-C(2))-methyltransferase RlmN [candidate division KSB1 bacterium]RQW02138.1 MAG: 23S rRNA (adenine(2503)-C(2))-methyltransferase RlmN [candidate division KSB1 bacterium]
MKNKTNLVGLTLAECEAFAEKIGEKKYRGRQLYKWIYVKKTAFFDEMTDLPALLRDKLAETARIGFLEIADVDDRSLSGSVKYLFKLPDNFFIESVYIPDVSRKTLCISSQVGCALNCRFCATAKLGLKRHLSTGEIVDQVLTIMRMRDEEISNIVFMGMGEPFANYENVIKAATLLSDDNGLAIGARRIVISTAGIADKIIRYADEGHKFRLAISLNSPFQEQRSQLMPISRRWDVNNVLAAVKYYAKKSRKIPTLEYVLLDGLNDTKEHATALKKIVKSMPCKVNLIPYNPTGDNFSRPGAAQVNQFAQWLLPLNAGLSVRWSKGDDSNAACGQLAGKKQEWVR